MTAAPLISIIVPVYNAEKYLNRCVDSITAQTFTDWECLLIDDGSTDESPNICDEYARRDHRIRVFHKKNGGVASVRQYGMEKSTGDYIIHMDADDWADAPMLESMYKWARKSNAEFVIADFYIYQESKDRLICHNIDSISSEKVCKMILREKMMGKLFLITIMALLPCLYVQYLLTNSWGRAIIVTIISTFVIGIGTYYVALDKIQRRKAVQLIRVKLHI